MTIFFYILKFHQNAQNKDQKDYLRKKNLIVGMYFGIRANPSHKFAFPFFFTKCVGVSGCSLRLKGSCFRSLHSLIFFGAIDVILTRFST